MTPETRGQLNYLARNPNGHVTMETSEAKQVLLEMSGNMMACGYLYDFVVKDIGAGVCKVSLTLTSSNS